MGVVQTPTIYALQFRGEAVARGNGRLHAETRAPSCVLVTVVSRDGVDSRFDHVGSGEAICTRDLELRDDGTLVETGEITFGAGAGLSFRASGEIAASPDPRLRHGTAVCEVIGGRGRLA